MGGCGASVKLVEQELWQREEKGLIGILPVRDAAAESSTAGSLSSPGDYRALRVQFRLRAY